jgi:hypothetical protein
VEVVGNFAADNSAVGSFVGGSFVGTAAVDKVAVGIVVAAVNKRGVGFDSLEVEEQGTAAYYGPEAPVGK